MHAGMRPGMQPGMSQATPAHLQAMQNMARLQHSMQQQQSGQPPGSMPGQMPPGMRPPAGFPIGNPGPGGIANPAALAGLGNAAPMGSPAALGTAPGGLPGQPRPAMPPMAPGQMMAGGLPGAQVIFTCHYAWRDVSMMLRLWEFCSQNVDAAMLLHGMIMCLFWQGGPSLHP